MANCLHSGGSVGFDKFYEEFAKREKHLIKLYHFDGHKNTRLEVIDHSGSHYEPLEVTKNDMELCNIALELASKKLHRNLPKTGYERHLLERDYFLVSKSGATSLYASGHLHNGVIEGGTGFIVELFVDHNPTFPVYFHCIESSTDYKMTKSGWEVLDRFPKPRGQWIGIGSRRIN